jgi:hypothetical protein
MVVRRRERVEERTSRDVETVDVRRGVTEDTLGNGAPRATDVIAARLKTTELTGPQPSRLALGPTTAASSGGNVGRRLRQVNKQARKLEGELLRLDKQALKLLAGVEKNLTPEQSGAPIGPKLELLEAELGPAEKTRLDDMRTRGREVTTELDTLDLEGRQIMAARGHRSSDDLAFKVGNGLTVGVPSLGGMGPYGLTGFSERNPTTGRRERMVTGAVRGSTLAGWGRLYLPDFSAGGGVSYGGFWLGSDPKVGRWGGYYLPLGGGIGLAENKGTATVSLSGAIPILPGFVYELDLIVSHPRLLPIVEPTFRALDYTKEHVAPLFAPVGTKLSAAAHTLGQTSFARRAHQLYERAGIAFAQTKAGRALRRRAEERRTFNEAATAGALPVSNKSRAP